MCYQTRIPYKPNTRLGWKNSLASSLQRARIIRVVGDTKTCVVLGLFLMCVSAIGWTQDVSTEPWFTFDIPQQRADHALTEFAEQADLTLMVPHELVRDKQANALIGEYTLEEGAQILLDGTGLSPEFSNAIVMSISADERPVDQGEDMKVMKKVGFLAALAAVFTGANAQEETEESSEPEVVMDEIVVTGTTIRGVYPESQPLDIYTAEDIALSGATTVNRFLETLPQNVNSLSPAVSLVLGSTGVEGRSTNTGVADLRGFGPGTTLTLLNGRRLVAPDGRSVNTALIPLAAVDRIEVLSDGASAVYGSDAIGGVVNFILRDEFDGLEVSTSYGAATRGGHDRAQADVAAGRSWGSGSGFVSYSYLTQSALDVSERDFSSQSLSPSFLYPDDRTHSVMVALDQNITDRLDFFGSALYSRRDSETRRTSIFAMGKSSSEEEQLFFTGGFEYQLSDELYFQIDGTYLFNKLSGSGESDLGNESRSFDDGQSFDLSAKVDGDLFNLPAGAAKFSLGGGYSEQGYESGVAFLPAPFGSLVDLARQSKFVFAEGFFPLIGELQGVPGIERLEISAAIRYTDYSDIEGAATPRFGLLWSPLAGLNLRATYSRGFRAPTLQRFSPNFAGALVLPPAAFGLPDPFSEDQSSVYVLPGGVKLESLTAEFSDTYTVGFDFQPEAIDGLSISVTYFSIDYMDRLNLPVPNINTILVDPEAFSFLINSSPTRDEVLAALPAGGRIRDFTRSLPVPPTAEDVADVATVLIDNRFQNLASAKSEGLDIAVDYGHEFSFGDMTYGARVTHTFESTQRTGLSTPEISVLDGVGLPNSLRGSVFAGVSRGGLSGRATARYVDTYANTAVVPQREIDSWTTVDLSLNYALGDRSGDLLANSALSLTVQNLFDTDPPFIDVGTIAGASGLVIPAGYDPVNANPLGRFVTVGLRKRF